MSVSLVQEAVRCSKSISDQPFRFLNSKDYNTCHVCGQIAVSESQVTQATSGVTLHGYLDPTGLKCNAYRSAQFLKEFHAELDPLGNAWFLFS